MGSMEHRLGLVISRGRAYYGHNFGLMLPMPILKVMARFWNHCACMVLGHDDVLWHLKQADSGYPYDPACSCCGAPLYGCAENHEKERYGSQ